MIISSEVSVTSTGYIRNPENPQDVLVQCGMSDGSVWVCKPDGTDWKQSLFSFQDLTDKFHAELEAEKTSTEKTE